MSFPRVFRVAINKEALVKDNYRGDGVLRHGWFLLGGLCVSLRCLSLSLC